MSTTSASLESKVVKKSAADFLQMKSSAFERLPDEIIEQILQLTSPNSFASLIILNRKWRVVSQQAHLYAHHLSRCPSYAAAHHSTLIPEDEDSLPRLRRLFAREIKRNLFEAYLRPRETVISLVSTSISSSSAPGGEAFHFSLSPRGYYVLAYSSSRIHVIDVTGHEIEVKREFKILRRPASTTITDDGSLLAVLSTDLQVDLYDLTGEPPKHIRAVTLDYTPRTIALSPTGSVLAAAYDSGVEVSSLDPSGLSTDRRAVKCYAVDSLSFSRDGTQLLGTTMQSRNPSTVVLTAPYYDPGGSLPEESVSTLWTTSILFPNGSRDCSHAVLLPSSSEGEASWTFTYDRVFETFRAVRVDDLRNGTTYFTGPIADSGSVAKLLPSTLPAAAESGDLVASGFQGAIWLYGCPEDFDAVPVIREGTNSNTDSEVSTPSSQLGRRNSAPSLRSVNRPRESISRVPQWQLLCDRFRNTFVEGRMIGSLDGVSAMTWVDVPSRSSNAERLVAVAPGVGGQSPISEDDGMNPVDGGRISILDFDYIPNDGKKTIITIEVGMKDPEVLEEEHRDLDTEVAIVRRRTVAQRQRNCSHVSRSVTTTSRLPRSDPPPMPTIQDDPFISRTPPVRRANQQTTSAEQSDTASVFDEEVLDAPYSHSSPRSGNTLRRAATAAAVNRRLNPRVAEHIEYRRADGRNEHPHESDADNWVPPPPPYSRDPVPPLPEHIQRSLLAEAAAATAQRASTQRAPNIDFPGLDSPSSLHRSRTIAMISSSRSGESRRERQSAQRSVSDTMNVPDRISFEDEGPRPMTSPISPNFDDLYDVSPPGTPQPTPRRLAPVNSIPRRPVGAPASNNDAASVSPNPVMQSPIPQPNQPFNEAFERRLREWEGPTEPILPSLPKLEVTNSSMGQKRHFTDAAEPSGNSGSQSRPTSTLLKQVPPRPNDNHYLTEPRPTTSVMQDRQESLESLPTVQPTRSETAPVTRSHPEEQDVMSMFRSETAPVGPIQSPNETMSSGLALPSADQLARLNSRKGRPRGISDPRRVSLGSAHQPPKLTPEQAFRNVQPRAAQNAYGGSPQRSLNQPPSGSPYSSSPSRRIGVGNSHSRNGSNGSRSPNLRPPMQRLETIHSQSSTGELSPYFAQKSMILGRQPSRAERSAAKNIKDAKKKGWRASMRRDEKKPNKDKMGDGASSAGWTDVSRESAFAPRYSDRRGWGGKDLEVCRYVKKAFICVYTHFDFERRNWSKQFVLWEQRWILDNDK